MSKEKLIRRHRLIIVLMLAVVFVNACSPAPMSTSSPPAVALTPTTLPPTLTSPPPTLEPTSISPTPTALSLTATNPLPNTAASTEKVRTDTNLDNTNMMEANQLNIEIGDQVLTATLVENASVDALKEVLVKGSITIKMHDYGNMEKVGSLGMDLPRTDQQITTESGDIILYQGNSIVIYYAPNSWNFTRLGKINNVTAEELRAILGDGDVTVTLSLPQEQIWYQNSHPRDA